MRPNHLQLIDRVGGRSIAEIFGCAVTRFALESAVMTTRLFHISDVHFGVEDHDALAEVVRAILEERPDGLICTGDITQRAKLSEYEAAAQWFAALPIPVMLEPGNHDMPYYNLWERFSDPYRRFRNLNARVGSVLESEDVVLVSLKTTVRAQKRFPWSDGVVTRQALAKTVAALEVFRDDPRHLVVTAHHPLLGPENASRNPTIGGDHAFAALAQAGAQAVLSGHVHVPFDMQRCVQGESWGAGEPSMRAIGAGTLSTRLRHGAPASYRALSFTRGGAVTSELRQV